MLLMDLINSPADQRARRGNKPEEDSTSFHHQPERRDPQGQGFISRDVKPTKQQNDGVFPTRLFGCIVGKRVNASILQSSCINNILWNIWNQFSVLIITIIISTPALIVPVTWIRRIGLAKAMSNWQTIGEISAFNMINTAGKGLDCFHHGGHGTPHFQRLMPLC
jgi:hypothetical protein